MRVLIRGGRVITATEDFTGDVLITDGVITAVGHGLDAGPDPDLELDARGRYVIPGAVDTHTHMRQPVGMTSTIDDFASGTAAAAAGGTTTIVDFAIQRRGEPLHETIATWRRELERTPPYIDVGFHIAVVDLEAPDALAELAELPALGIPSFKLFMAYPGTVMVDDRTMLEVMRVAERTGALVLVHAENGHAVELLTEAAIAAGHRAPVWHARTRPEGAEAEATGRAIELAAIAGCPIYVVHVSCAAALAPVSAARTAGRAVFAETCPQYLLTSEADLERPGFEGAKYVFSPPPRAAHNQDHLWNALATGDLDALASDHCPYLFDGDKTVGRDDFSLIPNGAPGVHERVILLHHFGVTHGRLSLQRWVELTATTPARLFGLFPRKGTIAPGSDADIVVFDPEREARIAAAAQPSNCDYSLYEGIEVTGMPEHVLVRGEPVVVDGQLLDAAPRGEWLARARFGESLAPRTPVAVRHG
jgi:dihydropyrimidinase